MLAKATMPGGAAAAEPNPTATDCEGGVSNTDVAAPKAKEIVVLLERFRIGPGKYRVIVVSTQRVMCCEVENSGSLTWNTAQKWELSVKQTVPLLTNIGRYLTLYEKVKEHLTSNEEEAEMLEPQQKYCQACIKQLRNSKDFYLEVCGQCRIRTHDSRAVHIPAPKKGKDDDPRPLIRLFNSIMCLRGWYNEVCRHPDPEVFIENDRGKILIGGWVFGPIDEDDVKVPAFPNSTSYPEFYAHSSVHPIRAGTKHAHSTRGRQAANFEAESYRVAQR